MEARKMLVIDDESVVLESCRRIFSEEGFEVRTTTSAREGLELVSSARFDVILCDWKMPQMDGVDVVEVLDKRSPDTAIIMISGYPSLERATEVMKRGAMDYVPKPFTPDEITSAVARAVNRRKREEAREKGRIEGIVKSIAFPVPSLDDQSPQTIAETVARKVGVGKTTSPWLSVFVLGILAGAYIGFGGMLSSTVTFDLAARIGTGLTRLVSGSVFSLGLMLVVIAGAELFTGNNLMVSSAMTGSIGLGKMLERWALVFAANFIGAVMLALLFVYSGLWKVSDGALGAYAVKVASAKVNLTFIEALLRGVGCNWLVCLAVWMALASRQTIGKIFAIFFPIMGFVALGFEHSVANMYFIPVGVFLKTLAGVPAPEGAGIASLGWDTFLVRNLLPVTLGNVVGGGLFVGMSYWGAYLRNPPPASPRPPRTP
ncbi:MAG TPA: formate/nitrite family transporter [Spirochaetia bacterium]|nr:formate/nitrite family transporter [Spirochaetia bacterium]